MRVSRSGFTRLAALSAAFLSFGAAGAYATGVCGCSPTSAVAGATSSPSAGDLQDGNEAQDIGPEMASGAWDNETRAVSASPPLIPVLLFHFVCEEVCPPEETYGVTKSLFATMLTTLRTHGYTSITSRDYARAMRGDRGGLPTRPVLITFDDGRLDAYTLADPVLRGSGMRATMFVITDRQDAHSPRFMSWSSVEEAHASGRWDIQLHAADGHVRIPIRAQGNDVEAGAFFGNRRYDPVAYPRPPHLEPFEVWKTRVESDLSEGIASLRKHIAGFEPVAFAVPYGDIGQRRSNDERIAPHLRALFDANFRVWFTQDDPVASPSDSHQRGRYTIFRTTSLADLMSWITNPR